jgi:hypothetical protein
VVNGRWVKNCVTSFIDDPLLFVNKNVRKQDFRDIKTDFFSSLSRSPDMSKQLTFHALKWVATNFVRVCACACACVCE